MKLKSYSLVSLLFAAALMGCSRIEETAPPTEVGDFAYNFLIASDETKTTYGDDHIVWETDDLVGSYASTSVNKSTPVQIDDETGKRTITVKSSVALKAGDKVYAYYPYNSANDGASKNEVTLEIPTTQVSGDADAMPMVALPFTLREDVASDVETEVGTLRFINLGSIIKLSIYSSDSKFQGETIQGVTFVEENPVAGSFTYDITNVNVENPAAVSGYTETSVRVNGAGTVGTNEADGGVLYMVVAPGKYKGKFIIHTNMADYTYDSSSKEREYTRATVKPLNINLASTNWVAVDKYDNSIDSPRELVAFLKGTSAEDTDDYTISTDLDLAGYTLPSASGFGGTLDGGGSTISNLVSSLPIFAQNSGTISNLNFDETCSFTPSVDCVQFGALVGLDNGGTYNSISTAATIKITATANIESNIALGGIVGATNSASGATFDSCSNGGAITVDATNYTHWPIAMGGIVGWVKKAAFNSCTNSGPITLTAKYHDPYHQWQYVTSDNTTDVDANTALGGIVGKAWDINNNIPTGSGAYVYTDAAYGAYFESCSNEAGGVITLTHTEIGDGAKSGQPDYGLLSVGGIMGQGNGYVNKGSNYAPINVSLTDSAAPLADFWQRKQSLTQVGGIVGKSYQGIGMNSCTNRADIYVGCDTEFIENGKERYKSSVGGLCGSNGYDKTTSNMRFSTNWGKITVRGYSTMNVGGICGSNGSQRGNRVYDTATIDVQVRKTSCVGGLVGFIEGSAQNQRITTSYCEADIKAESVRDETDWISVGGLIGECRVGNMTSYPSLIPYSSDTYRCHYSGEITATDQVKVGMLIGWVSNDQPKVFGSESVPIQVHGTLKRSGMDSPVEINSTNVEEYAIGNGTATIYLESVPAIKVMSLNLREAKLTERMPSIIEMIRGEKPDILGLQEVKVLKGLDALTDYDSWNAVIEGVGDIYEGTRQSGQTNGFIYNPEVFEVTEPGGVFYLRDNYDQSGNSWDGYLRTAQYVTLKHKSSGQYIFFINTHYPLSWTNCEKASAVVEERVAALNTNNYPVIMVGDFNCTRGSGAFDSIMNSMRDAATFADDCYSDENKALYTYNAYGDENEARYRLDHIWYSHPALDAKYYEVLTQEIRKYGDVDYLSDHYPVSAIISF